MKYRICFFACFILFVISCGPKQVDHGPKIHQSNIKGGDVVPFGHDIFPMIVKVFANDSFCTGTLIARDVVLTAAHCVVKHYYHFRQAGVIDGFEIPRMIVRVYYSDGYARDYRTKNIIAHEEYDPKVWITPGTPYDMALLKLEKKVDEEIKPAKVLFDDPLNAKLKHQTFGYGHFTAAPNAAKKNDYQLRKMELKNAQKHDIFLKFFDPIDGPCIGDSGGPSLIIQNNEAYVTGVLSFALPDKAMSEEQRLLFTGESGQEANWDALYEKFPDYDECAGGEFFYTSTYALRDFLTYYLPRL